MRTGISNVIWSVVVLTVLSTACGNSSTRILTTETERRTEPPENSTQAPPSSITVGAAAALKAYDSCTSDAECGSGLRCIDLLGSRVCSATGCASDPDICLASETCVVSAGLVPSGVCAFAGTDQFCARNCRDLLRCNLKPECTTRGCCGSASGGCPDGCATMDPMECEIAPQCPVECCP